MRGKKYAPDLRATRLIGRAVWVVCLFVPACSRQVESDVSPADEPFEVRFQESRFHREPDMFPAADEPRMITAAEVTDLLDDDEVLGFFLDGQARAYGVRPLAFDHVINDRIGDTPIAVTY